MKPLNDQRALLEEIAGQVGTPTYVYDATQLRVDSDR